MISEAQAAKQLSVELRVSQISEAAKLARKEMWQGIRADPPDYEAVSAACLRLLAVGLMARGLAETLRSLHVEHHLLDLAASGQVLEQLYLNSEPVPGRPGWRMMREDGNELPSLFYSDAWVR